MLDYEDIISKVNYELRQILPYPIVEQASTQKQPPYPYGTYTVTSPYLNPKTYRSGDTLIEEVEIVVSYTWLSVDSFECLNFAQRSSTLLKSIAIKQRLTDGGITVVRIDGFGSRDNFMSIEVERRVGFDVRLRVRHSDSRPHDVIETVN